MARRLLDLGASQLSLGDTIGVGTAGQVKDLIDAFGAAGIGADRLAMHFHDTYGQALANASPPCGGHHHLRRQRGRLGGCPYAESATGNLATEDLVWMLTGWASSTVSTSTRSSRPACGWPIGSGRRARRQW